MKERYRNWAIGGATALMFAGVANGNRPEEIAESRAVVSIETESCAGFMQSGYIARRALERAGTILEEAGLLTDEFIHDGRIITATFGEGPLIPKHVQALADGLKKEHPFESALISATLNETCREENPLLNVEEF